MALDRYGNSKGMSDALDDDLIDMLHEMGSKSLREKKEIRRIERTKKHPQKAIDKITTSEFMDAVKTEITSEITTSRKVDWILKDVDEDVNWIIQRFGVKDFRSIQGKVYYKIDKDHQYPIFKTNFESKVDHFREWYYEKPVLIACIPTEMKISEWRMHVIHLIYGCKLTFISEKVEQTKKKLKSLHEQEKILRSELDALTIVN